MQSDAIVCISKAVADDFQDYTRELDVDIKYVGWSHLGCNLPVDPKSRISNEVEALALDEAPIFLSVGTVEPRKGYSIALDAFDSLWNAGVDVAYVIVGKYGWSHETVRWRILDHEQYGVRLFWFQNASDADLEFLYKTARALILPSIAEGFGLPLAEAALHGLPALVSDMDVFREIARDQAVYFIIGDAGDLAEKVSSAMKTPKIAPTIKLDSWSDSALGTLRMLRSGSYQKTA